MTSRVAVVAEACEFPEGRTPQELWSTVLHERQCFRHLPSERIAIADYTRVGFDPDSIYRVEAALLEGYQFNREQFRVPKSSFDRTDMSHWLALDVATRVLGSVTASSVAVERDSTCVIVANTLTGEFSRANLMRYRWPYVERRLRAVAAKRLPDADIDELVLAFEVAYKSPFPAPDEDSLAGGLSNTIAGRIANHHGLRGGAHTVDGACASSLVAVISACERLAMGDVNCVLVGAVDLSLDPFELVGFARNGALARDLMRVFDEHSAGFWPGEGCGFLLLANESVVLRHSWPVLAWIRGAAMSTDGKGSLTRPTVEGQVLAARRAWTRAGLDPAQADYFEAHGTGTAIGDPVELAGLGGLLGSALPARPIPIGSVKANIGHTKAAAGMAGLLKAIAICRERVIPATTGCVEPHPLLQGELGAQISVPRRAEQITHGNPVTVGVNSFGFGGINCHVVVESSSVVPARQGTDAVPPVPTRTALPGELLTLQAPSREALAALLHQIAKRARTLSRAQLPDLAFALNTPDQPAWRASLAIATPQELGTAAAAALLSLQSGIDLTRQFGDCWCWSAPTERAPRIALLFPGQGLPLKMRTAPWALSFPALGEMASQVKQLSGLDLSDTAVVQSVLAEVTLAGLALLQHFEIEPALVLGHSFGELSALHAAGRIGGDALRALAAARGQCMRDHAPRGAMLALQAPHPIAMALADEHEVDVACQNGPDRSVLAGDEIQIGALTASCAAQGIIAERLPTNRAFHSRLMSAASEMFSSHLAGVDWRPARLPMISSVTGRLMDGAESLTDLLAWQLVSPVKFVDALDAVDDVDLVIEVASSAALCALVEESGRAHAICIDVFGESLLPLLEALGAVWVCGGRLNRQAFFEGRLVRPCRLDDDPLFLVNACGVPADALRPTETSIPRQPSFPTSELSALSAPSGQSTFDALCGVVAELTGLESGRLKPELRLLADLHLNSIRARYALSLAARRLGLTQLPFDLARLANASLEETAVYLDGLRREVANPEDAPVPETPWLRLLSHDWAKAPSAQSPPEVGAASPWPCPVSLDDSLAPLDSDCRSLLNLGAPDDARCLLLVLPAAESDAVWRTLLRVARHLATPGKRGPDGMLILQCAQLANGFMRSVAAELPHRRLCVVEVEALDVTSLCSAIVEYQAGVAGYSELRLRDGKPQLRVLAPAALCSDLGPWAPSAGSVLVVTGGARGIGAATALALASRFCCRLAIVGRSTADAPDVVATMAALSETGCVAVYFRADLADPVQARAAVGSIECRLGTISAVFHAAGINHPLRIASLDEAEIEATLASKLGSLDALLEAMPVNQLGLLVGYCSIIGELGLAGEAHYALANEWLVRALARHAEAAPTCRVIPICWSAWRETGMAARIEGVLDDLQRSGTRALDNAEAIAALERLLAAAPSGPVIVSGRYGRRIDHEDRRMLQTHRYLERPRIFYPGIELVADAQLCSDGDRYLQDHAPFGVPVLPLVCALEAMVSAAQCLWHSRELPLIEGLQIGEVLSCMPGQHFLLRTSALVDEDGSVRAEIRSQTTGFESIHFSARLCRPATAEKHETHLAEGCDAWSAAELLYQGLGFHGPRFQRLGQITALSAHQCEAHTISGIHTDWIGPLLPQDFAAGDPGLRDAALQALQLCVPHQVVLPVAAERIRMGRLDPVCGYRISTRQTYSDGQRFVFDLDICDLDGGVVEEWTGLALMVSTAVQATGDTRHALAPTLLAPLIQRIATDLLGAREVGAGVVVGLRSELASSGALARALGRPVLLQRRPDGAIAVEGSHVSTTHGADITLALTCPDRRVAIDLQFTPGIDVDAWCLMLDEPRLRFATRLAEQERIPLEQALLVAWTATECLVKLGRTDWPFANAACTCVDTTNIGPILILETAGLRLAVATLTIATAPALATLSVALEDPFDGAHAGHRPRPAPTLSH